jgi:hypothetical protein
MCRFQAQANNRADVPLDDVTQSRIISGRIISDRLLPALFVVSICSVDFAA